MGVGGWRLARLSSGMGLSVRRSPALAGMVGPTTLAGLVHLLGTAALRQEELEHPYRCGSRVRSTRVRAGTTECAGNREASPQILRGFPCQLLPYGISCSTDVFVASLLLNFRTIVVEIS